MHRARSAEGCILIARFRPAQKYASQICRELARTAGLTSPSSAQTTRLTSCLQSLDKCKKRGCCVEADAETLAFPVSAGVRPGSLFRGYISRSGTAGNRSPGVIPRHKRAYFLDTPLRGNRTMLALGLREASSKEGGPHGSSSRPILRLIAI